jgi:hypothetical protein
MTAWYMRCARPPGFGGAVAAAVSAGRVLLGVEAVPEGVVCMMASGASGGSCQGPCTFLPKSCRCCCDGSGGGCCCCCFCRPGRRGTGCCCGCGTGRGVLNAAASAVCARTLGASCSAPSAWGSMAAWLLVIRCRLVEGPRCSPGSPTLPPTAAGVQVLISAGRLAVVAAASAAVLAPAGAAVSPASCEAGLDAGRPCSSCLTSFAASCWGLPCCMRHACSPSCTQHQYACSLACAGFSRSLCEGWYTGRQEGPCSTAVRYVLSVMTGPAWTLATSPPCISAGWMDDGKSCRCAWMAVRWCTTGCSTTGHGSDTKTAACGRLSQHGSGHWVRCHSSP